MMHGAALDAQEINIRQKVRQDYREDRCNNPYYKGTLEYLLYMSEEQKIKLEGMFDES